MGSWGHRFRLWPALFNLRSKVNKGLKRWKVHEGGRGYKKYKERRNKELSGGKKTCLTLKVADKTPPVERKVPYTKENHEKTKYNVEVVPLVFVKS